MPLMILGLILLAGILVYAVYNYSRSSDDSMVSGARRDRENRRKAYEEPDDPEQKILSFPTDNVEVAKR